MYNVSHPTETYSDARAKEAKAATLTDISTRPQAKGIGTKTDKSTSKIQGWRKSTSQEEMSRQFTCSKS